MRDPARCREALPHEVPVARDPARAVKRSGGGACVDLAGWRIHPRQGSTRLQNHSFGRLLVECWCLDAATCFSCYVLSDLGSLGVCPRTAQGVNHALCRGAWQWPRISHEILK